VIRFTDTQFTGNGEIKLTLSLACCALAATAVCSGATMAQSFPPGRIDAFHSQAHGNCPAMVWHIVAEANGTLEGMIS